MEVITEITQSHFVVLVILGIIITCVVVISNIPQLTRVFKNYFELLKNPKIPVGVQDQMKREMTEFEIKPVKKVIVSDLNQEDLQNFLYICRITNISSAIWVEGMIIVLMTAADTDKNVERFFEGIRIYERVFFVKYPKYTKTVKWNGGNYELPLRNYQNFSRFREFGRWIKSQPAWKTTPEGLK